MSNNKNNNWTGLEIAVIGMAGRFPQASNLTEFWNNLKHGKECISFYTDDELLASGIDHSILENPKFIKAKGGILDNKDCFDAAFFDYTPKEAEIMDPQIRVFHECAYNALVDAAYDPFSYEGLIGLIAGCSSSAYWQAKQFFIGKSGEVGGFAFEQLTNKDFFASRVAYKLNLKGPCVSVQTACSTSLVAIHMACRALLLGECNMALAGGVKISHHFDKGYMYQEGMIFSADGRCRAFDIKASGTVSGEGVGVVVLKPLKVALKDRDQIYAIIKGSAVNNDGSRKVGYTAPSVSGQYDVIETALAMAKVEPESISYIEAHGSGTSLGDAIEVKALKNVYKSCSLGTCRIGSVKTNIGHLDAAAGVAGFMKTVLSLYNRQIPPSLNFDTLNTMIELDNSPLMINNKLYEWENEKLPLRAGISSIAIGGTNAHVILEAAPIQEDYPAYRPYYIFPLSAKTEISLEKMTHNMLDFLKNNTSANFADICYTLQIGRKAFQYKKMLVCKDAKEAIEELEKPDSRRVHSSILKDTPGTLVFMFSGLGGQYINMGLEFYKNEPVFRNHMNYGFEILEKVTGRNYKEVLYPEGDINRANNIIHSVDFSHPLMFIFEYSLSRLLMEWGIKPDAMIGYSLGEYVAACIAGVFSYEEALNLVLSRAELIKKAPKGGMLSVPLMSSQIEPLLENGLSIAIDNGESCIIAGQKDILDLFEKKMKSKRYLCMRLNIDQAVHTSELNEVGDDFKKIIMKAKLAKPQIRYISNVTGGWVDSEEIKSEEYWFNHMTKTVQFAKGIKELSKLENAFFIEIGPGSNLSSMVKRIVKPEIARRVIETTRNENMHASDSYYLLNKVGQLWLHGIKVDWHQYYLNEQRRRVSLPLYPFDEQRFPVEVTKGQLYANSFWDKIYGKTENNIAEWFYVPVWKTSQLDSINVKTSQNTVGTYLIFSDQLGIGYKLAELLRRNKSKVIIVKHGASFTREGSFEYEINPESREDYYTLFDELRCIGSLPEKIFHLWNIDEKSKRQLNIKNVYSTQEKGFFSLINLAKALSRCDVVGKTEIQVFLNNMFCITGDEVLFPEKATVMGPLKVIRQEYPNINCRCIDISIPQSKVKRDLLISNLLLKECLAESSEQIIAYRGQMRFAQVFERCALGETSKGMMSLRRKGIYLITGGLGKIGFEIAKYLAKTVEARLILIGRTQFPRKENWDKWILDYGDENSISKKIKNLRSIEDLGGEMHVYTVNVANQIHLKEVIEEVEGTLGNINGVIHAAGVVEGDSISLIEDIIKDNCMIQFEAKVCGLLALERVLDGRDIDFCILMSSTSTVLGGLGFAAYAAVNSFMDTFAHKKNMHKSGVWMSVNWGNWGLSQGDTNHRIIGNSMSEHAMTPSEGVDALERILAYNTAPQIVVSRTDLQIRINKWVKLEEPFDSLNESTNSYSDNMKPELSSNYIEATSDIESKLVDIWQRFFGFNKIGIDDNFFELGGDSLKAITLIPKIHKVFDTNIPVSIFFKLQTIKELAKYIESAEKERYLLIEKVDQREYYPLSSAQKRLFFLSQYQDIGISYNSTLVFQLEGKIDISRMENAFRKLITRHEILRTSFHFEGGQAVQRIHDEYDFCIEVIDKNIEEVDKAITSFIRLFDLTKPPLIRVGFLRLAFNKYIMIIDIHHICTDGVSLGILLREIAALYNNDILEPLSIQYKDFAYWQKRLVDSGKIKNEKDYWLRVFHKEPPILNLPTDYIRQSTLSFSGKSYDFYLEQEYATKLKMLSTQAETTSFMSLLSVFYILLHKYTDQHDIVVGTGIAGRHHADLEDLIGLFVNLLPLRNSIQKDISYLELLDLVRENCLQAFEHQYLQFEDLVDNLNIKRDPSRNSVFDVTFVVQNFQVPFVNIEELTVKPYPINKQTTYYDLTLFAYETDTNILFRFVYADSLFKSSTIEKMASRYIEIVKQVTNNKDVKIKDIWLTHNIGTIDAASIINDDDLDFNF